MPIITTNQENDAGDGYLITSDNTTLVVSQNVTVLGSVNGGSPGFSAGNGISAYDYNNNVAHFNITLYNYGNVLSDSEAGINIGDSSGTGFGRIINGASGSVSGYFQGVNLGETNNTLTNAGQIDATDSFGYGVDMDGQSGSINNTGSITGGYTGIFTQSTSSFDLRNSGTISSLNTGLLVEGYNSATIAKIYNSGLIDGGSVGISCSGAVNTTIRNTGKIDGNVRLGDGANSFDGRGGSVNGGYIQGGTKVDTITLGNDGEIVNGGAGHDALYGGTGDDTFAFNSYASANSDTIFGFNVSDDLVQLNHAQFTKLTAGATPTFTVGSSASSATDYLFYNSGSGNLFYDPDGSGAGAANLVAKLDPGLKMTAHDFKVI